VPFVTAFDISQKPFEWWWPAIGLLFVAIGIIVIRYGRWLAMSNDSKIMGWVFVIFGSGVALGLFVLTYSTYSEYLDAYKTGRYSVVEGLVEDFHPLPYEGHQDECFRVEKQKFCYSDYEVSPAFNQTASHGGPIRAGLPVRVAYIEDADFKPHILRLEIRSDMMPSAAERTALSKSEESKWKKWTEQNPYANRYGLGFYLAAFLISLCWNLDWRHYLRYWIGSGPPYSRRWELAFRAFFLACVVGSAVGLVRMVTKKHWTLPDLEGACLYALIGIGFFGVSDLIFRRRLRASDQLASQPSKSARNLL
jgi:hypothetical protein